MVGSGERGAARSRVGDLYRRHRTTLLTCLVLAVLPFLVFLPRLFGGPIAPGDGWVQDIPGKLLAADALRHGRVPSWTSTEFSGWQLYSLGHFGVIYPPNLLLVVWPSALALNLILVLHLSISAVGSYLLGLRVLRDRAGALLVGLAFGLGPFRWAELSHPAMLTSVAWLPWAVLGVELARRPGRWRTGVLVGAVSFALCILAGHPQMMMATVLAVGAWAVVRAVSDPGARTRPFTAAAALLALGGGLAGVQLVPSLVALSSTVRGSQSYEAASSFAFEGRQLPNVLFPFASGGGFFSGELPPAVSVGSYPYLGAVVVVLAVAALPSWRRARWILPSVVVGAGVIVAALSPLLPPLGRLLHLLPPFSRFRIWNRYFLIAELLAVLVAGYGVKVLGRGTADQRRQAVRWAAGAAVAYALAAVVSLVGPLPSVTSTVGVAVPVVLVAGTVAAAVLFVRGGPRWLAWATVALAAVDLVVVTGLSLPRTVVSEAAFAQAKRDATAKDYVADADGGVTRFVSVGEFADNVTTPYPRPPLSGLSGARSVNGYDSLAPGRYIESLDMDFYGGIEPSECVLDPARSGGVLDLLRVSSVLVPAGSELAEPSELGDPRPVPGTDRERFDREPGRPEAWVAPAADVPLANDGNLFCASLALPEATGSATVTRPHDGRIEVQADAAEAGVLVVSEAYDEGWTATVDGEPVDVVSPYGLVLGVPVEAGEHEVVLTHHVRGLALGAAVSGVSVLVALGLGVTAWRRRDPDPAEPPASGAAEAGAGA